MKKDSFKDITQVIRSRVTTKERTRREGEREV